MLRRANEAFETRRVVQNGEGESLIRNKFRREEMFGGLAMFAEFVLAPGQRVGRHTHGKNMDVFYVLSGELTAVNGDGSEERIFPGDTVLTGGGESHELRNDSDREGAILAIVSPETRSKGIYDGLQLGYIVPGL